MESYELSEDDAPMRAKVVRRVEQFFLNPKLETREAFDEFVKEAKRVKGALDACNKFLKELKKFRLRYTTDDEARLKLREQLGEVQAYCKSLEDALEGSDAPKASRG
jgi:hypothetical protein